MEGDIGSEATYRSNWVIVSSDLDRKLFLYQRPLSQALSQQVEVIVREWVKEHGH